MTMITTTKGGIKYTYPTGNLWKQERVLVYCERASGSSVSSVFLLSDMIAMDGAIIATYYLDNDGKCTIDLTDYIRMRAVSIGSTYTLYLCSSSLSLSNILSLGLTLQGLIDPESVLIPSHRLGANNALIIPPRMIYPMLNEDIDVKTELYTTQGSWSVSGLASMTQNGRTIGEIQGDFILTNGTQSLAYKVRSFDCGIEYANVSWTSLTGVERSHYFEVVKRKSSTHDAYSLLSLSGEYIDIKGREDGFTLRLDRLDAYDLWYYADILHSSKVTVSLNGEAARRVQVTDKSITLPDGEAGTNGVLEIAVNYRAYDAVAM